MDQPKGELQEKIRPVAQHREMRDFREMRDSGRCAIPGDARFREMQYFFLQLASSLTQV